MSIYTKLTTLTFQNTVDVLDQTFVNALLTKITQMISAGKTDGSFEFIDEYRVKRFWLDQDAADEWIQFVAGEAELYNVVITDYLIGDNIL